MERLTLRCIALSILLSATTGPWAAADTDDTAAPQMHSTARRKTEQVGNGDAQPGKGIPLPLPVKIVQDKEAAEQTVKRELEGAAAEVANLRLTERNAIAAERQAGDAHLQ